METSIRSAAVKPGAPGGRTLAALPAVAAMAYPFWLQAAHALDGPGRALALLGALAMPMASAAVWVRIAADQPSSARERLARCLALLAFAAPPWFVFLSFALRMLGQPLREAIAWVILWAAAAAWVVAADARASVRAWRRPAAAARVVHGGVAVLVLAFVAFHLFNHLVGWLGPQAHASVMQWGRRIYRMPGVEAMLVVVLLLQIGLGARLAWRWSAWGVDRYRAVQMATGVYVGFFLLAHMNSALVSARLLNGTETDWAWASAAPVGLLDDAWSIRLVPHYGIGVFCVLSHLACGLRAVLLAHGWQQALVNRAWRAALVLSGALALLIVAGLCGLRVVI